MLSAIVAIIGFGLLIIIHEGGHFLTAKLFGIYIEKFSIGFGPVLFSFKWKETEFRISLIPLGGYVKMKGENPDEDIRDNDAFSSKAWWQKALIAFAGPFFNLLLAFVIIYFLLIVGQPVESMKPIVGKVDKSITDIRKGDRIILVNDHKVRSWDDVIKYTKEKGENQYFIKRNGREVLLSDQLTKNDWMSKILPKSGTIVGDVSPGMPAYLAGIKEGDKILKVNGVNVNNWYQLRDLIVNSKSDTVELVIQRKDEKLTKKIPLQENILNGTRIIGITQYMPVKYIEKYNPIKSLYYALDSTIGYTVLNYVALYKIIIHPTKIKENIGGPVMLYAVSKSTAKKGLRDLLMLLASISILLMVMNLLPIPILDGGNIFFFVLEGIMKKPLSVNIQVAFQKVGLTILLLLMFFAFTNDIFKLTQRHSSVKKDSSVVK